MMLVSPSAAPIIETIAVRSLCAIAANSGRFDAEQARLALGAISNLYCLYALENRTVSTVMLQGLTSDGLADRRAVLAEIRRAAGLGGRSPESMLEALSNALDQTFTNRKLPRARLSGFGVLEPILAARSCYRLALELPLSGFLKVSAA